MRCRVCSRSCVEPMAALMGCEEGAAEVLDLRKAPRSGTPQCSASSVVETMEGQGACRGGAGPTEPVACSSQARHTFILVSREGAEAARLFFRC